jgi:hypothetical protein
MPVPSNAWYSRWKARRDERGGQWSKGTGQASWQTGQPDFSSSGAGFDGVGPQSTNYSYEYLLRSLKINAPGFSDQNPFTLSRAYTGSCYLAVHTKAIQASLAEYVLYENDGEDELSLSPYEDVRQIFENPNPDDSFGDILEQTVIQKDLTGTALIWCPPSDPNDSQSPPVEQYVLSTASCLPQPISPRYPNGAWLVQPWYPAGPYAQIPIAQGVGSYIPAEQIIRIKDPHPFFRWIGYATLFAISTQMDASRMIDVSRLNTFSRGIDPTALLSFDAAQKQPTEADLRRMEAQFQAIWGGPANAGRLIVVPGGAQLTTLSNMPKDMAYQEGWIQLLDFGLASFGVNKAVAGITTDLNYSTLFASLRAFYLLTLDPLLAKIARMYTMKLIKRFYNRSFGMRMKGKAINDDELKERQNNTLIKASAIKVGELRKDYGLPPSDKDDEWASLHPEQPPGGQMGAKPPTGGEGRDAGVEQERPHDTDALGSLGPQEKSALVMSLVRKGYISSDEAQILANKAPRTPHAPRIGAKLEKRFQSLMGALERAKSHGHAFERNGKGH